MVPAAAPTPAELKLRRNWVAQHFDGKATAFPFTFTYGGRPGSELLASWKLERQRATPQPGRTLRTLTCTDPATGLRVRCDAGKWRKKLGEEKVYKYFTVIRRTLDECDAYVPMGEVEIFLKELRKNLPIKDEIYSPSKNDAS